MRENHDIFSHHEALRFDYLLQNIHYLNENEQAEYQYLLEKQQRVKRGQITEEPHVNDSQMHQSMTDQGLPAYPQKRSRKKSFKKSSKGKTAVGFFRGPGLFKRLTLVCVTLTLLLLLGMAFMFVKGMIDIHNNKNIEPAVTEVFNGKETTDGTNILILGSDQRITEDSKDARTDTIMVMNIGNSSGKIKLVSFMRDTLINIPGASFNDYVADQKLNVAFNLGEQDNNQGAELMRVALKNNFDLDIKYYIMLDFETFAQGIDTLFPDGVEIDAQFSTIDGQTVSSVEVPNDVGFGDQSTPYQTIHVGQQRMNGQTLLNYARYRSDDEGDFGRTRRQQQVMTTVISQIDDLAKLFSGSAALGQIYALTSTNISFVNGLGIGLSNVSSLTSGIEQTTIPANGDWVDEYDMYGGLGLGIDFDKYKEELANIGLR